MGLMQDLIDAKLAGERIRRNKMGVKEEPVMDEAIIEEVKLTRDAIINFLSSEDLVWTINKFKASVELEEITTDTLNARVETDVNTNVSTTVNTTVNGGMTGAPGPVVGAVGAGTGTGTGKGTGNGTVSEGLNMRKDGGGHGGYLKAVGYAYIGGKEVENVENVSTDNTETEVRLDYDRIPEELK
ncbi:MAG: hypothetical protein H8D94_00115 [Candidatus Pelagibacter sp.]|nr:hypothetical protein [Candidatus Pelagibacter sp.]